MKRKMLLFLSVLLVFWLSACSSNQSTESSDAGYNAVNDSSKSSGTEEMELTVESNEAVQTETEAPSKDGANITNPTNRKIIYNANLRIEVEDYSDTINEIQSRIQSVGGYIVESQTYGGANDELQEGMIKARIPQEQFQSFIAIVEKGSVKVLERTVTGQDVTEEFVDLQSRLKAKKVVEKRLLSFMEKAEKTEDLLKISSDLATVQEEIEEITGRMNYLQNRADLATVTIHLHENRVMIPNVKNENLNTWEKTKQQFMESINFILSAGSSLIIFLGGNLPIFIIIGMVGLFIIQLVRRQRKTKKDE